MAMKVKGTIEKDKETKKDYRERERERVDTERSTIDRQTHEHRLRKGTHTVEE
jgi:hypothetical protein